jgi:hypothetical protein
LNQTIEQRRLQIHRTFPEAESLHDCMKRSVNEGFEIRIN